MHFPRHRRCCSRWLRRKDRDEEAKPILSSSFTSAMEESFLEGCKHRRGEGNTKSAQPRTTWLEPEDRQPERLTPQFFS